MHLNALALRIFGITKHQGFGSSTDTVSKTPHLRYALLCLEHGPLLMMTSAPTMTFRLMDLPLEIRQDVYRLVLKKQRIQHQYRLQIKVDTRLLQTSKAVCEEARFVLYSENKIRLEKHFLSNIGSHAQQHLRHLVIKVHSMNAISKDWRDPEQRFWTPYLGYLSNLQSLDIVVDGSPDEPRSFLETLANFTRSIEAWYILKVTGCPTLATAVCMTPSGSFDNFDVLRGPNQLWIDKASGLTSDRKSQLAPVFTSMLDADFSRPPFNKHRTFTAARDDLNKTVLRHQGILSWLPPDIQVTLCGVISGEECKAIEQHQSGVWRFQQLEESEAIKTIEPDKNKLQALAILQNADVKFKKYMWIKTEFAEDEIAEGLDSPSQPPQKRARLASDDIERFAHIKVDKDRELEWRGYLELSSSRKDGTLEDLT